MYSTSGLAAFGVVGEVVEVDEGRVSNADRKDASDTAVCGSGMSRSSAHGVFGFGKVSSFACVSSFCVLNGFWTSLATFITTSNVEASASFGSR